MMRRGGRFLGVGRGISRFSFMEMGGVWVDADRLFAGTLGERESFLV